MEEKLAEFKKNILLWYPFKNEASLLCVGLNVQEFEDELSANFKKISFEAPNEDEKYDYITYIKEYDDNFSEDIKKYKDYLKEDGKLLIAINNKFGLKNWNTTNDLNCGISQNELKQILSEEGKYNLKFYYVYPSFTNANLIYSDDYKLTREDITRNFYAYDPKAIVPLNENKVYNELLKEGKECVNKFANSFFIEISKQSIENNIKYVTFSNYRKKEYRVMTIIDDLKVYKKPADKEAIKHINNIANNIEELKKNDISMIEELRDNVIESNFLNSKRFDIELSESANPDEFYNNFKVLKQILDKDLVTYEELKEQNVELSKTIREYDEEKLYKLHFLKKAFIDLVPKNMFLINGKLNVFDQEWNEDYIPVEYIYYRAILNTSFNFEKYTMDDLFQTFRIKEYIDLFEKMEKDLRDKTFDYDAYYIFFREYLGVKQAQEEREFYLEKSTRLEAENHGLNLELEDAREQIVDYANQLRVISNSTSWKIVQFFRKIFRKIFKRK